MMSYKNPQMQRNYQREWMRKNRHRYRIKEAARIIAWRKNKKPQKCESEGCARIGERHHEDYSKPEQIRWFCRKHHKSKFHSKKCTVKKCNNKHLAKGFCNKHYKHFVVNVKKQTLPPVQCP